MAPKRSRIADFAVYLLVRTVVCIVQSLSWDMALGLARGLAWLAFRFNRRHRQVAVENVQHAFPHLDAPAVDRLVRASYLHFATMLVEIMRVPRVLRRSTLYNYFHHAHADDLPQLWKLAHSGRPSVFLTGHFGNWELVGVSTGARGAHASFVARRLDNPYLDRYLNAFRSKFGITMLDKNADYARIISVMTQGTVLGMVADQDAGARGLFVNFFGRPASTYKSIALLALEYNAPIVVVGAARVGQPMRYRYYFEDLILPEEYAAQPDATRAITQRFTEALERMVRRHPEQYFWFHRRWKHQPAAKKAKKAAA